MPSMEQNIQGTPRPLEDITLLLISPHDEDLSAVRGMFRHPGWKVEWRRSISDARSSLTTASVVLCERDLPDGDWKKVLDEMGSLENPAMLVVISRHADELLWAEVLNLGGYDVLQKPFETSEILRVVNMAWRQRKAPTTAKSATSSPINAVIRYA